MEILSFIESLAETRSSHDLFNQYDQVSPTGAICRTNLILYLEQVRAHQPTIMLLAEAPGYQGCRLTGIPFTSEYLMLQGVPEIGMLGADHGYRQAYPEDPPSKEPSATIVWQTLARIQFVPLLWSSVPFHPHKVGNPRSNRAPRSQEVDLGRRFWQELAEIMEIDRIVAIGNVAERSLVRAGITTTKIRHPSQGGKPQFVDGIEKLAASLDEGPVHPVP